MDDTHDTTQPAGAAEDEHPVSIRLPRAMLEKLDARAAATFRTRSLAVRLAIAEWLERGTESSR